MNMMIGTIGVKVLAINLPVRTISVSVPVKYNKGDLKGHIGTEVRDVIDYRVWKTYKYLQAEGFLPEDVTGWMAHIGVVFETA
jgi:hypothetical protein